jgi:hypothetical protein
MNAGIAVGDDVKYEPDTSGQPKGGLKGGKARADKLSPGGTPKNRSQME